MGGGALRRKGCEKEPEKKICGPEGAKETDYRRFGPKWPLKPRFPKKLKLKKKLED